MVCSIEIYEKPQLNNPVLIEGLPGIGFIANIAALHLITELKAKKFAHIVSSSFQDCVVLNEKGNAVTPMNELYYVKRSEGERDLIIWYGNTQALSTSGQYELTEKVLDIVNSLGCNFVISIGGFKKEEVKEVPILHIAATDITTLKEAQRIGGSIMVGHIFGIAGILIGLQKLRNMKGFALLIDTIGSVPDSKATIVALTALNQFLKINIDLTNIEATTKQTKMLLEPFGVIKTIHEEKKKEEQELRWYI